MTKTILVVDDSGSVRQQVVTALKQAGFTTVQATDGREGLAAIESDPSLAMVICDLNMPNMNGIEMLEELQRKPVNRVLPVLMLTTEAQPSLVKRAKAAGAVGWMVKPFDTSLLVQTAKYITKTKN